MRQGVLEWSVLSGRVHETHESGVMLQTRGSAHSADRGEPRVAQEGQQMAERAFPSELSDGPVAVRLQSEVNRSARER